MSMKDDKAWSLEVKKRDNYLCRIRLPGCLIKATDACHIFGRNFGKLRHNIDNGLAGCRFCHGWIDTHPKKAAELLPRLIESKVWDRLAEQLKKFYKIDVNNKRG